MVGLAGTLGQVFNLLVFNCDLLSQKIVFAFETDHEFGRDRARHVAGCRGLLSGTFLAIMRGDIGRDLSRLDATCRDRSHLLNIGNMLID